MRQTKRTRVWLAAAFAVLCLALFPQIASAATKTVNLKTLKNKEVKTYRNENFKSSGVKYVYHKFKVPKTGFIVATGAVASSAKKNINMNLTLCNDKKVPVDYNTSNKVNSTKKGYIIYAVKKGTYYLRYNVSGNPVAYVLGINYHASTDKGKNSKSKAESMSRNTWYADINGAGGKASTSGWFKFKVNGKKKVLLTLEEGGQGPIELQIIGPQNIVTANIDANTDHQYLLNFKNGEESAVLPAGTYYLKFTKSSDRCNYWVKVKWDYV